ncbi:uncharacterized protein LOC125760346 [Rhipicephalus sanguineus]|uniref:uncharacterized protein LOC125760346 n=1 Tax=Rhipicephalus sanguineus TaxID=34632 RepID=UPI0020C43287|nr:uncharacterized protein LOC125760346 [Rhipicephalus sanguineus]
MAWLKLSIGVLLFGLATATPTRNLQREGVDTFRTIGAFRKVVAISTSTNDTSFKCLTAIRTNYDAEAKTATYVWLLRGHGGTQRRNVTFTISAGTVPHQANYFVDADNSRVYTGYTHLHGLPELPGYDDHIPGPRSLLAVGQEVCGSCGSPKLPGQLRSEV